MNENLSPKELNITPYKTGFKFEVKVIPNSSKSQITDILDGVMKIKLNSPPVEGAANKECILLISKFFKVPKSAVSIISGEKSKNKTVFVDDSLPE